MDKQGKKKVLSEILQKVVNCKFSDVMNMVHEQNIAKGSEKTSLVQARQQEDLWTF